jgi:hypothetical protein
MQPTSRFWALAALATASALAACGNDDDDPTTAVDELGTGSYVVSTNEIDSPTVGKYYAGADGSRLLVLTNSSDQATQLYRRAASGAWVAVPNPGKDVSVKLLNNVSLPSSTPTVAGLVGSYVAQVSTGTVAAFSVAADGRIVAGSSSCQLSGQLSTGALPGTLALTLSTTGCASLPASSTGVLTVDSDYAPGSFRLVTDNGAQVVDLWGFKE